MKTLSEGGTEDVVSWGQEEEVMFMNRSVNYFAKKR
jgi:hypothetical protein